MKMREAEEKVRAMVNGPISLNYERWDHGRGKGWETECKIWIAKLSLHIYSINWRQAVTKLEMFLEEDDLQTAQPHPDEEDELTEKAV